MDCKPIATATKEALSEKESSWVIDGHYESPPMKGCPYGHYRKRFGDLLRSKLLALGYPKPLMYIFYLADKWENDLDSWADAVLADKYDELYENVEALDNAEPSSD